MGRVNQVYTTAARGLIVAATAAAPLGCQRLGGGGTSTVRGTDGSIQVTLPAGWQVTALPGGVGAVQAKCVVKHAYVDVVAAAKADVTDADLRAFTDRVRANAERTGKLTDRQSTPVEAVTIDGRPAFRYAVTGVYQSTKLAYVDTFVQTDRYYVLVMGWTIPSHVTDAAPDFDALAVGVADAQPRR